MGLAGDLPRSGQARTRRPGYRRGLPGCRSRRRGLVAAPVRRCTAGHHMSGPRVLISGALAGKAGHGGEAWVRLGWIAGAHRLGCEVTFVEVADVSAESAAA